MKFRKTHTKHVPYHLLPCIKISSPYLPFNTLNFIENHEKKAILDGFSPIASAFRLIPAEIMVGPTSNLFRDIP